MRSIAVFALVAMLMLVSVPVAHLVVQASQPPVVEVAQPQEPPVSISEAEATRPGVPPAAIAPSDTLRWMIVFAIVSNFLMRKMRESKYFPFIKSGAGWVNVTMAGAMAMAASAGIHTEFDYVAGSYALTGATLPNIMHFIGEWGSQWAIQQGTYQTMKPGVTQGTAEVAAAATSAAAAAEKKEII